MNHESPGRRSHLAFVSEGLGIMSLGRDERDFLQEYVPGSEDPSI